MNEFIRFIESGSKRKVNTVHGAQNLLYDLRSIKHVVLIENFPFMIRTNQKIAMTGQILDVYFERQYFFIFFPSRILLILCMTGGGCFWQRQSNQNNDIVCAAKAFNNNELVACVRSVFVCI